jgi:uncharacterized protein YciI
MEQRMRYFVLIYHVGGGFVTRRAAFREKHLTLVGEAHARGELVLAGAMGDPVDRALLVFRARERATAEEFARADPYVTAGLVERWEVQPWAVVVGLQPGDFDPLATLSPEP